MQDSTPTGDQTSDTPTDQTTGATGLVTTTGKKTPWPSPDLPATTEPPLDTTTDNTVFKTTPPTASTDTVDDTTNVSDADADVDADALAKANNDNRVLTDRLRTSEQACATATRDAAQYKAALDAVSRDRDAHRDRADAMKDEHDALKSEAVAREGLIQSQQVAPLTAEELKGHEVLKSVGPAACTDSHDTSAVHAFLDRVKRLFGSVGQDVDAPAYDDEPNANVVS